MRRSNWLQDLLNRPQPARARRRSAPSLAAETVERRLLLTDLNLSGTPGDDTIFVNVIQNAQFPNGRLQYQVNGVNNEFALDGINTINVALGAGADLLIVNSLLNHSLAVLGQAGNDTVFLAAATNSLRQDLGTANVSFDGGADADALVVSDSGEAASTAPWTINGTSVRKSTTGAYTHAGVETVQVNPNLLNSPMNVTDLDTPGTPLTLTFFTQQPTQSKIHIGVAGQAAVFDGNLVSLEVPVNLRATSVTGPGAFSISNTSLTVPVNFTSAAGSASGGRFVLNGTDLTGTGTFTNQDGLIFFGDCVIDQKINNQGLVVGHHTELQPTKLFTNAAAGVVRLEDSSLSAAAANFVQNGQVELLEPEGTPSELNITGAWTNNGTILGVGGARVTAASITNQGTLQGSLTLNGPVSNKGTVSPGASPGTITVNGNYTQTATGRLLAEIGATSDLLDVNGTAALAGTLTVTAAHQFTPVSGTTTTILTANSLTGDFGTKNTSPAPGLSFTTAKVGGNYNVTARNSADLPRITGFGAAVTHTEGNAATVFAPNSVVSDSNSANFNGGNLTARLTAGAEGPDRLEIRNQGTAAGQIGVSGSSVTFGGATIGTFTGGAGAAPLVVTLNASATPAATQALLRNLTFRTASENPGSQPRTVQVTISDGVAAGDPATKTLNVVAVNDAPAITGIGAAVTYVENAAPLLILANTTAVADPDSLDLATGKLTVSYTSGGTGADRLAIRNQGTAAGQIGVSGSDVTFGGTTIGTFTGGTGLTALEVTFNASATPAAAQALLRNITFANVSETPATTNRVVRFTLTDGDGGTGTAAKTVRVTAVNDAPALGGVSGAVNYTAGGAGLVIASTATVADVDSADFNTGKLTVRVAAGGQASLDKLEIRNQGIGAGQVGVNGTNVTFAGAVVGAFGFNSTTLTLTVTFNASATAGIVQAVARNVTFRNTSATPATAARTVEFQLTDGDGGTSAAVTKTVNVAASALAVNSASAFAAYEEWQTAL